MPFPSFTDARSRLRREVRRRRRPLAAVLAACAMLAALSVLRSPATPAATSVPSHPTGLAAGQVAVPVELTPPGIARVLKVGQVVDLVAVSTAADAPDAHVVSRGARILSLPDSGGTFTTSSSAIVVVAVNEGDGLDLLATSSGDTLTAVFRDIS